MSGSLFFMLLCMMAHNNYLVNEKRDSLNAAMILAYLFTAFVLMLLGR